MIRTQLIGQSFDDEDDIYSAAEHQTIMDTNGYLQDYYENGKSKLMTDMSNMEHTLETRHTQYYTHLNDTNSVLPEEISYLASSIGTHIAGPYYVEANSTNSIQTDYKTSITNINTLQDNLEISNTESRLGDLHISTAPIMSMEKHQQNQNNIIDSRSQRAVQLRLPTLTVNSPDVSLAVPPSVSPMAVSPAVSPLSSPVVMSQSATLSCDAGQQSANPQPKSPSRSSKYQLEHFMITFIMFISINYHKLHVL